VPDYAPSVLLYDSRISGNCYKVRLLFAHLGVQYERREVDVVDRSDRFELLGDVNPGLRVPSVVLDDGRSLGESDAILFYFASGTPYLPDGEFASAQVLQWMFFEQYSHEPHIAVLRFWALHPHAAAPSAIELAAKRKGGTAALEALERHLGRREFLVADTYTIADIALYAYTHVAGDAGFDLAAYPHIRAWLARVAAQPGHVPIDA
jgi:glutathione S-transferase